MPVHPLLLFLLGFALLAVPGRVAAAPGTTLVNATIAGDRPSADIPNLRWTMGDDPRYAEKDYDDGAWTRLRPGGSLPARTGIYWVRFPLPPFGRQAGGRDTLLFAIVASYEVYVDGQRIGASGVVGASPQEEIPGPVDGIFRIPDRFLDGEPHLLALRVSAFRSGFPSSELKLFMLGTEYRRLIERRATEAMYRVLAIGGALALSTIFFVLWWFVERRNELLLFGLLGLMASLVLALQAWRWLYDYPYEWHYPRLVAITAGVSVVGVLLVACLGSLFRFPQRHALCALLVGVNALPWIFASEVIGRWSIVSLVAFVAAAALSLWAVLQRRPGARIMLAGMLLSCALLVNRDFLARSFFLTFGSPMVGALIAVSVRLRQERRAARQAQLTAARLEIELLKKNIQPHFLLNTLTALMEVIEHQPRTAVTLIEALAGEFRILARISGERLVPIVQELDLCRTHLRVMSLRKDVAYELETSGIDEAAWVPPALFLTLLENGLTHPGSPAPRVVFRLQAERSGPRTHYRFFAPGGSTRPGHAREVEGTGLRYVRARLEESFSGRWSLRSEACADGWLTEIVLVEEGWGARESARPAVGTPPPLPS